MLVSGPQRHVFFGCLGLGLAGLIGLDAVFGPQLVTETTADRMKASSPPVLVQGPVPVPVVESVATDPAVAKKAVPGIPAIARVPTIVARFDTESSEPSDQTGIRALAAAMIEEHDITVVLEGHSDTRGAEDYNQQISLARADWVKGRLVDLGVSADRVQTVGLGATRPLRADDPDAQAMNRRVEVRWLGR
jgi:OOP family OmpA-OmpF porin